MGWGTLKVWSFARTVKGYFRAFRAGFGHLASGFRKNYFALLPATGTNHRSMLRSSPRIRPQSLFSAKDKKGAGIAAGPFVR